MCFSATASFAACGLISAAGLATSRKARADGLPIGQRALAAVPLAFGVQQGFVGLVWMGVHGHISGGLQQLATIAFLFFAVGFWPIVGPVLGFLNEARPMRRWLFAALIPLGIAVGGYIFVKGITPVVPVFTMDVFGAHLVYLSDVRMIPHIEYIYFAVACTALILSSNGPTFRFGLVLTGSFVATVLIFNVDVLTSVWCFFAALCSLVIVWDIWRGFGWRALAG